MDVKITSINKKGKWERQAELKIELLVTYNGASTDDWGTAQELHLGWAELFQAGTGKEVERG